MGNRSKMVIATVGSAALAASALSIARRRRRFAVDFEGVSDELNSSEASESSTATTLTDVDKAHAPGHRHLSRHEAPSIRSGHIYMRPFAKHQRGFRHPGRR